MNKDSKKASLNDARVEAIQALAELIKRGKYKIKSYSFLEYQEESVLEIHITRDEPAQ